MTAVENRFLISSINQDWMGRGKLFNIIPFVSIKIDNSIWKIFIIYINSLNFPFFVNLNDIKSGLKWGKNWG